MWGAGIHVAVSYSYMDESLTREGDETRNEAVIPLAMDRWGKPYHRRSDATRGGSQRCLFRFAGRAGAGCIVFDCDAARRNHQGSRGDDQRPVRAGKDIAESFNGTTIRLGSRPIV